MAIDIPTQWRQWVNESFPDLIEGNSFEYTSPVDFNYNCLSWALSINHQLLDEVCGGFWPWPWIDADTADGWAQVCAMHGFTLADTLDTTFVAQREKIVILENAKGDLHAARQDRNGRWKSKLGPGPDIDHDGLVALESEYGRVVRVLYKQRPDW